MTDNMRLMFQMMQRLVDGYGGRVRLDDGMVPVGRVQLDVEFPAMHQATTCADTMTRHEYTEELERLLPRPALSADLPPDVVVASIHGRVTLRFVINPKFMQHVVDQAARSE